MNEPRKYLALCLDPVHIGTGGYRLGRVDMSIVREPATGIPKIPGTSLAGAVRAYAELAKEEDSSFPEVNVVFGTTEGQGMLRFYDAQVALFPVHSQLGTVWVSTAERLKTWFPSGSGSNTVDISDGPQDEDKVIALMGIDGKRPVHLGWLLLETEKAKPSEAKVQLSSTFAFVKRLVLVSDKLFYHLVNDHLEVRTSVKIDDKTGAAESRGLFTYEAIPRGTVLGFEVAVDRRGGGGVVDETTINKLLNKAFAGLKVLGVGGMGTRGFGRIEVLKAAAVDRGEQG